METVEKQVDDTKAYSGVGTVTNWSRIGALAKALAAAQKTAEAVGKDARNTFHGYAYASAEALIAEARAALSGAGLSVLTLRVDRDQAQPDHRWEGSGDDAWIITPRRIRCTYLLMHESGESMLFESTTPVIPERGRPEDKAEFGARTENLGYAMRDLLLLPRVPSDAAVPSGRDDTQAPAPRGPRQQPSAAPQTKPAAKPSAAKAAPVLVPDAAPPPAEDDGITPEQDTEIGRLFAVLKYGKAAATEMAMTVTGGKRPEHFTRTDGEKLIAHLTAQAAGK